MLSTRLKPRRKPRLRVVGSGLDGTRHATVITLYERAHILEVWTFAEWERLKPWERPTEVFVIPGLGVCDLSNAVSFQEARDVQDVVNQAIEEWRDSP